MTDTGIVVTLNQFKSIVAFIYENLGLHKSRRTRFYRSWYEIVATWEIIQWEKSYDTGHKKFLSVQRKHISFYRFISIHDSINYTCRYRKRKVKVKVIWSCKVITGKNIKFNRFQLLSANLSLPLHTCICESKEINVTELIISRLGNTNYRKMEEALVFA